MNEEVWDGPDVRGMLDCLSGETERKLYLFAAACCRSVWKRLLAYGDEYRAAVEAMERFADGEASVEELGVACSVYVAPDCWDIRDVASIGYNKQLASRLLAPLRGLASSEALPHDAPSLLRSIMDPFSRMRVDPAWVTRDVALLAEAAYAERLPSECVECGGSGEIKSGHPMGWPDCRRFEGEGRSGRDDGRLDPERLGVLSDALEEAGCDDRGVLSSLRSAGPHYRGLAALDLVLGKR